MMRSPSGSWPMRFVAAAGVIAALSSPTDAQHPGDVWVNKENHTYHCAGSKWYGKTKKGEYMSEAAARGGRNHSATGKACGPSAKKGATADTGAGKASKPTVRKP